jgi:hypothetical protein
MAVPEGSVGGLRWAWWSCWMSGRRPRKLGSVDDINRVGRFGAVLLEVRLLQPLESPVSSRPIVDTTFSLQLG